MLQAITLVASIAYFTMASNLGYAAILVEFQRSNPKVAGEFREIFYVRYIDWFVTTPVSSTFWASQASRRSVAKIISAPSPGFALDSWDALVDNPVYDFNG